MGVIKSIKSRSFKGALKYISKEIKTNEHLMTGIGCSNDPKRTMQEWQILKKVYNQTGGRSCVHFTQSFAAAEKVTLEEVHQIAIETVERCPNFKGHQVFIATHFDQKNGNYHSHIVANSVNYETGNKWQMSQDEYQKLKDIGDQIYREHGLTVTQKGKTFEQLKNEEPSIYHNDTYRILHRADEGKADSWVYNTAANILEAMQHAFSKEHFCELLEKAGVITTWTDSRKNITFQRAEGIGKSGKTAQKIRDSKLAQYFKIDFSKEFFENEFNKNLQRAEAKGRIGAEGARAAEPTGGVESSIYEDRGLEQLGLNAQRGLAERAERDRQERERREAAERARAAEEQQRREREAAAAAARKAEQQRKAARTRGSSIAD